MLTFSISFFILAIIAGVLGFSGIAGSAVAIAQTLFYLFLIGSALSLIYSLISGKSVKQL